MAIDCTTTLPADILQDRNDFLAKCKRTATGKRDFDKIMVVLDRLIEWSLKKEGIVAFVSSKEKDQATLKFAKVFDSKLLWEAYPSSRGSDAKVAFFTRASTYLSDEKLAIIREKFRSTLSIKTPDRPGSVLECSVKRFSSLNSQEALIRFLEWACQIEDLEPS